MYGKETNLVNLREQKRLSPSKRVKFYIIKSCLKNLKKDSKILEIGCGVGDIIGFLDFKDKLGVDISLPAIKKAKKMFPNCKFKIMDASRKLKLNSKSFDAILLPDIIEHLEKDEILLNESHRLLKPGGYLIIFVPYSGSKSDRSLINPLNNYAFGLGGDLREYGWNLINRVNKKGFEIISTRYIFGYLGRLVWNFKEVLVSKNKRNLREEVMTGKFINKKSRFFLIKRAIYEALYLIYLLDYKLFSNKNHRGILLIVASKNQKNE